MTSVRMIFSYNNGEKIVETPVIPNELPEIVRQFENEEMATHTRNLTLIGRGKARSFSLNLFLPVRDYYFCKGNGEEVLSLFKTVTERKIPGRMVVTDGAKELLNIAFAVKSLSYHYDRVKNIRLTAECVEYEFVNDTEQTAESEPVFGETAISYGENTAQIRSTNREGYNLVKARDVCALLGKDIEWNAERKQVIADGELLDIHTEVYGGYAYCYIRDMADIFGLDVDYDPSDKSVRLR